MNVRIDPASTIGAVRLFLGTFLNPANQRYYAGVGRGLVTRHGGVVRAIPAETAHLTYVFSADAADGCLDAVVEVVQRCVASIPAFDVQLGPPHVLLAGPRPRLVCADVTSGALEFTALALDLLKAVTGAQLPLTASGTKSPHVTLARFSKKAGRSDARIVSQTLERGIWAETRIADRVSNVQVVVSQLTDAGPVYEVRAAAALP